MAQSSGDIIIDPTNKDFSAVESYFKLADLLKQNSEPSNTDWGHFFQSPINSMMISAGVMDTLKFKNNLREAFYSKKAMNEVANASTDLLHHYMYKFHEDSLKKHIDFLKSSNLTDTILSYLSAYLPARLCSKQSMPKQYYIFYGSEEATAGPGIVINDLYLSYKIDRYKLGLLSAHEAFHSIVTEAFSKIITHASPTHDLNIDLLYFLSNISQEGVADLIDKPLLMKSQSPLKMEVEILTRDEWSLASHYIIKLDSLLKKTSGSFAFDFRVLSAQYGKNGGHIPGRVMATIISDNGLLPELLPSIEDPVHFFELYCKAVDKGKVNLPSFSKESLIYLNELRQKFYKRP